MGVREEKQNYCTKCDKESRLSPEQMMLCPDLVPEIDAVTTFNCMLSHACFCVNKPLGNKDLLKKNCSFKQRIRNVDLHLLLKVKSDLL